MIIIESTSGNGELCNCCRVSETKTEEFQTEQEAIDECLSNAKFYKWDFDILEVSGADDNERLKQRIEALIKQEKGREEALHDIKSLERDIANNRAWLDNLPAETARRQESLARDQEELAKLKKLLEDLDNGPQHEHDCTCCIFLGRHKEYDLYFHPSNEIGSWTLIGRFGRDGDYQSGPHISQIDCLVEARRRAAEKGLIRIDQTC